MPVKENGFADVHCIVDAVQVRGVVSVFGINRDVSGLTLIGWRWTEFDRGGHFAALEQPGLLVTDVRVFFRQIADHRALRMTEDD